MAVKAPPPKLTKYLCLTEATLNEPRGFKTQYDFFSNSSNIFQDAPLWEAAIKIFTQGRLECLFRVALWHTYICQLKGVTFKKMFHEHHKRRPTTKISHPLS